MWNPPTINFPLRIGVCTTTTWQSSSGSLHQAVFIRQYSSGCFHQASGIRPQASSIRHQALFIRQSSSAVFIRQYSSGCLHQAVWWSWRLTKWIEHWKQSFWPVTAIVQDLTSKPFTFSSMWQFTVCTQSCEPNHAGKIQGCRARWLFRANDIFPVLQAISFLVTWARCGMWVSSWSVGWWGSTREPFYLKLIWGHQTEREMSKYGLDDYLNIKYTCIGNMESKPK